MGHLHHIIPKHIGGTDDPDNLIELSINEHAREHYILWNNFGNKFDWLAWKGLTGMIDKQSIIREVQREGGSRGAKLTYENHWKSRLSEFALNKWNTLSYRNKMESHLQNLQKIGSKSALSEEARQKRKDSFKRIEHNKGSKNPMFGKMWITNGSHSYRIDKTNSIPEGYRKGRVI